MPSKTHGFTNTLKYGALAIAVLAGLALGVLGTSPRETPEAQAQPVAVTALNRSLCIALGSAFGGLDTVVAATACIGASQQDTFQELSSCLAKLKAPNGDPICTSPEPNQIWLRPTPELFAPLDLDKNQIFEAQAYLIIAFVSDDFPVRFTTEKGSFSNPDNTPAGQDFFCSPDNPALVGDLLDPDCDGDAATVGDGVVVTQLTTTAADGNSGTFNVNVIQESIAFPTEMTQTGPPEKITLTPLFGKDTIQTGASPATPGSGCDVPGQPGLCQDKDFTDCNFEASADAVLGAVAQAEKTIVVAKALDVNEVEVVGALITWHLQAGFPDNPDDTTPTNGTFELNKFKTGGVALPQTPTIDAGPLGVAFPQFVCGGAETGTIDLVARFSSLLSISADPDEHEEISINVISHAADMVLTADPPEMDCNGINTSKVTATVTNVEGDPVADGLDVRYSVVALGTANPLVANTAAGVSSTVVTALASASSTGVTVNVSVNGDIDINYNIAATDDPTPEERQTHEVINRSIVVRCTGAPPPPAADAGAGAAPPPPSGTISPPDTGSADTGSAGDSVAGTPLWALGALALGAVALAGTRLSVRGR